MGIYQGNITSIRLFIAPAALLKIIDCCDEMTMFVSIILKLFHGSIFLGGMKMGRVGGEERHKKFSFPSLFEEDFQGIFDEDKSVFEKDYF